MGACEVKRIGSRLRWVACRRILVGAVSVTLVALMAVADQVGAQEYEIGPGDVLRIEVLGRPEMTNTFDVDTEGMINYWEVGKVLASGHTTEGLERKLTTLLVAGKFVLRPQVKVTIAEYASQKVYVAAPGVLRTQGRSYVARVPQRRTLRAECRARSDRHPTGRGRHGSCGSPGPSTGGR